MGDPMNLPQLNIPEILRQYGLKPDKRLGQNFLVDPSALQRIVETAEIRSQDAILEIGPGLGSLTRYLASVAKKVVAVELDADLIPPLRDILEMEPGQLMDQSSYLVVANIPYYITSAVIRHLLEAEVQPRRVVLTVQREVAQRICAEPG